MTEVSHESNETTTNRLARSSSPYLLLHKHNPVDWYPWGPEALRKAREKDRPIFLSVGYSTCYWCHVMERESFSDPEIAALMNEHFVNIKVDREERPDLDEIYMLATQLMTQQGGWPNSVFLTPELKPFYAGTYFPPEDRYGRPGFPTVLNGIVDAWAERRDEIRAQADKVAATMEQYLRGAREPGEQLPGGEVASAAYDTLRSQFDEAWGGFGGAPKFPSPSNLLLLLELSDRERAREMLTETLDQMARGGIYDQLGGGFHRYATDREWKIPHFEKMLYDNGLLLEIYARTLEIDPDPQGERILRETATFLEREMTAPDGGFWSAIDAQTEGREGAFYVWTREELEEVLGEENCTFLAPLFGFDRPPFFEEDHFVLHLPKPIAVQAKLRKTSREELWAEIRPLREKLFRARAERERPLTDDKILADWNGLAISGLAHAGRVLGDEEMIAQARRAATFVLEHHGEGDGEGSLLHAWRAGEAHIDAFLADYAYLVRGLLALHRATGEKVWLGEAQRLTREQIERLGAPEGGFFVAEAGDDLLFQSKDVFDDALPNANAVAVLNLLELWQETGAEDWRTEAEASLRVFAPRVGQQPGAARTLTVAAHRHAGLVGSVAESGAAAPAEAEMAGDLVGKAEELVRAKLRVDEQEEGWRSFTLELEIAEGWHVNANPASEEFLIPTRVEARNAEIRSLRYPEGETFRFAFAPDGPLSVYEGEVAIEGELRTGIEAGEAVLIITYQACDDERCLPPVERELEVPPDPAG